MQIQLLQNLICFVFIDFVPFLHFDKWKKKEIEKNEIKSAQFVNWSFYRK